jgi:hypothetical protein
LSANDLKPRIWRERRNMRADASSGSGTNRASSTRKMPSCHAVPSAGRLRR